MSFEFFTFSLLSIFILIRKLFPQTSLKQKIYIDITHDRKPQNEPANMKNQGENWINRLKYVTIQLLKTASSANAELH